MAIYQECPLCKKHQSLNNKTCSCGFNLTKAKRNGALRYFHAYRIKRGTRYVQKKEFAGNSLTEALAVEGKRKTQKAEGILEKIPDKKFTFNELSEWYLDLKSIQKLKYYPTIIFNLNSFNEVFGDHLVGDLIPEDLREYQLNQKSNGLSDSYIDQQIGAARTMLNRAWENGKISGDTLRPFKSVKKLLKSSNANARDRILSPEEYDGLLSHLPKHLKPILAMGYHTGMRRREILTLTWDKVDMKQRLITLEPEYTKDKERRLIPINDELSSILDEVPRAIHDDHVFLYRGKPINDIRSGLKIGCAAAGIPYGRNVKDGFTFHDLRHTFNTNMRKAGVPESVIMEITGHSSRTMFDRYNTIDHSDIQDAAGKMAAFLGKCCQNAAKSK